MAEFQVDIVTPEMEVFSGQAAEVRAPGWEGEVGLLPEHDLFLTLLRAGLCTVTTAQGEQRYVIGRGFAEANPGKVTILTDSCTPVADIDKAKAKEELDAAEQEMGELNGWTEAFRAVEARREHASASLEA